MKREKHTIFLSYSPKDFKPGSRLANDLELTGFKTWLDEGIQKITNNMYPGGGL